MGKEEEKAYETREDVVRDEVWIKSRDMKGQVRLVSIIRDQNGDTVRAASLMSMFVSVHVCVNMCQGIFHGRCCIQKQMQVEE